MQPQIPRGVRNHNPGNIRQMTPRAGWLGSVKDAALTDHTFEQFTLPSFGVRALGKLVLGYQRWHGCATIRQIIDRWAPPAENDAVSYVSAVAVRCGADADTPYSVEHLPHLCAIVEAIIQHENGEQPYDGEMIGQSLASLL